MNSPNESSLSMASADTRNGHSTQLSGSTLILARGICVALSCFSLTVFFANLPEYFARLQLVCDASDCGYWQFITPSSVRLLQQVGLTVRGYAIFSIALSIISVSVWSVVGAIIAWRRSNDWMALLVVVLLVFTGVSGQSLPDINHHSTSLVASSSPWIVPAWAVSVLALFLFLLTFLLFPNGRFVPRWTHWLPMVVGIALIGDGAILLYAPSFQWLNPLFVCVLVIVDVCVLFAQIYRYRYVSTPIQRQQTKWVVLGVMEGVLLVAVGLTFLLLPPTQISLYIMIFKPIATIILLFAPLCFAIAILRYHLWDIDILIRRTLVYGTLSVILALVYGASIIFLQYLLRGIIQQDNNVAIVISTLVIAVLFQPLRHRIQASIDRRFYRRKYDATRTVADFSATLRHEVNLDQLREELVAVVQETMQPSHVSLWLRPTAPGKKHQETEISTPPSWM